MMTSYSKFFLWKIWVVCLLFIVWFALLETGLAQTLSKISYDFAKKGWGQWRVGLWNKASLTFSDPQEGQPLEIRVQFSGKGFEFAGLDLLNGQIPGQTLDVEMEIQTEGEGAYWILNFLDRNDKGETPNKQKLEWGLPSSNQGWKTVKFTVPSYWEQPLKVRGISVHNWSKQNEPFEAKLKIKRLEVKTDLRNEKEWSKLCQFALKFPEPRKVFTPALPPAMHIVYQSWLYQPQQVTIQWTLTTWEGTMIKQDQQQIEIHLGAGEIPIPLPITQFGPYALSLKVNSPQGQKESRHRLVYVPHPHVLSPEQKLKSPYGINIHGGVEDMAEEYESLVRLGITWIRDYAYNSSWMIRAKGQDLSYSGWPWYPKMDARVRQSGLMLLPCMAEWLHNGIGKQGKLEPDEEFRRELFLIVTTFAHYPAWELDNEYDLHYGREEAKRQWQSYDAWHKVFGQIVKLANPKALTVEQGTAGIHAERVEQSIRRGAFDHIDVVNAHHYCHRDPPEDNILNANTGQGDEEPRFYLDRLRELVQAARCDGKDRQVWITEFGWDTLAGHIVSEKEQAAYLQRGYLAGLMMGIHKLFWFWNHDTKKPPTTYFDGCGIFDPANEPKPSAAALAALAYFLPLPEAIGMLDIEPAGIGYIFRQNEKLVAAVAKLRPESPSTQISLPNTGSVYDMFGNVITSKKVELDVTPLWILNLPSDHPWVYEADYQLLSRHLETLTAGDTYELALAIHNRQKIDRHVEWELTLPEWIQPQDPSLTRGTIQVPAQTKKEWKLPLPTRPDTPEGMLEGILTIREPKLDVQRRFRIRWKVLPTAKLVLTPLEGLPGQGKFQAIVNNNRQQAATYQLQLQLPREWKLINGNITSQIQLGPRQQTQYEWEVIWQPLKSTEAWVQLQTLDSKTIARRGIQLGTIIIPRLSSKIQLDGDLSDWPPTFFLQSSVFGWRNPGDKELRMSLGWNPEGLWIGLEVNGSQALCTDPKWFWAQDCLEILMDTMADRNPRKAYTSSDHQFWICPLVQEKKIYAGRWKRHQEISETQYNLPFKGASQKTPQGYRMEFLIPATHFSQNVFQKNSKIGLAFILTVKGTQMDGEAFWPYEKASGIIERPHQWGIAILD